MNTRPAITTSSNRHAVVVAFAFAASMGNCAIAAIGQPKPLASGNAGRMHPGMEDA